MVPSRSILTRPASLPAPVCSMNVESPNPTNSPAARRRSRSRFQGRVVCQLQRRVQQSSVVAAVVRRAAGGLVRELVRLDEVAAAQLGGRDAQLAGGRVHQPLDDVGGLRAAGPAKRPDRVGVGEDGDGLRLQRVDPVRARPKRGDPQEEAAIAGVHVGAQVAGRADADRQHAPVRIEGSLGLIYLLAGVLGGQHVLDPGGDPLDRPAQLQGQGSDHQIVTVHAAFDPEAAAHVWRDHADLVQRQAQGGTQPGLEAMGGLGGGPDRQAAVRLWAGQRASRLHRDAGDAVMLGADRHAVGGPRERPVHVAVDPFGAIGDVARDIRVQLGRVWTHGGGRIPDARQRIVVNVQQGGSVLGGGP